MRRCVQVGGVGQAEMAKAADGPGQHDRLCGLLLLDRLLFVGRPLALLRLQVCTFPTLCLAIVLVTSPFVRADRDHDFGGPQ
jgi:hypothetical protein